MPLFRRVKPLSAAAEAGDLETVRSLIAAGADVNTKGRDMKTPLIYASTCGHAEMAKFLIAAGADVNAKDRDSRTPLHLATERGDIEMVKALISAGADVNAKDRDSRTPLHPATERGDIEMVKALISAGTDVKQGHLQIPLLTASERGDIEMVKALISAGADVNTRNCHGLTPLLAACHRDHNEIAEALIAAGANVSEKDRNGNTAHDYLRNVPVENNDGSTRRRGQKLQVYKSAPPDEVGSKAMVQFDGVEECNLTGKLLRINDISEMIRVLGSSTRLQKLWLGDNRMGRKNVGDLLAALMKDPFSTLVMLDLHGNDINDNGADAIATFLSRPENRLKALTIGSNNIGPEGAKVIALALTNPNNRLEECDLSNNSVGDEGAVAIASALEHDANKIKLLGLGGNAIGDNGARAIASALLHPNNKLTALRLSLNSGIGDGGGEKIVFALHHNHTLSYLDLRNTTLCDNTMRTCIRLAEINKEAESHDLAARCKLEEFGRPPTSSSSLMPLKCAFIEALESVSATLATIDKENILVNKHGNVVLLIEDRPLKIAELLGKPLKTMEDIIQLKLYYTSINAYHRLLIISHQERSQLITRALDKAALFCHDEYLHSAFELVLDYAEKQKIIDKGEHYQLRSNANVIRVLSSEGIRHLYRLIQENRAAILEHRRAICQVAQELDGLREATSSAVHELNKNMNRLNAEVRQIQNNVVQVCESLNMLRDGLLFKQRVQAVGNLVTSILNAFSFGAAGSAVQGVLGLSLSNIIDFGDAVHITETLGCVSASSLDSIGEKALGNTIKLCTELTVGSLSDTKLNKALSSKNTVVVVAAAAAAFKNLDINLFNGESVSLNEKFNNIPSKISPNKTPASANEQLKISREGIHICIDATVRNSVALLQICKIFYLFFKFWS